MRITRDTMLKIAGDAVARKVRASPGILAAYLTGSLLGDEYLLGGAGDIDLIFIHTDPIEADREIVRLTDDVHLDIAHHSHRDYREPRTLRVHPWLGPTISSCRILYDPQHFMDFTQAGVRGQFDRPENIFERSRQPLAEARELWFELSAGGELHPAAQMQLFLASIKKIANSIALLGGSPLTDRRMLVHFAERTEAIGRPELSQGLFGLLGAPQLQPEACEAWIDDWRQAYLALPAASPSTAGEPAVDLPENGLPAHLNMDRLNYYAAGLTALVSGPVPAVVLWPLLLNWTEVIANLEDGSPHTGAWKTALETLKLGEDHLDERRSALDSYLDDVEEAHEAWARSNGVWEV